MVKSLIDGESDLFPVEVLWTSEKLRRYIPDPDDFDGADGPDDLEVLCKMTDFRKLMTYSQHYLKHPWSPIPIPLPKFTTKYDSTFRENVSNDFDDRYVQGLTISDLLRLYKLAFQMFSLQTGVKDLLCAVLICLGFVMFSVCLFRV